jgi:hypothetical protein
MSARPGWLRCARPGTHRATGLAVPYPPVGCSLCHQSLALLFASLMPAAAADPSAALQGGLDREAAVGRRRRECCFAGIKGAPSSPRSSSVRRVGSKAVPTSSVLATPQILARCALGRHRERLSSVRSHRLAARKRSDLRLCSRTPPAAASARRVVAVRLLRCPNAPPAPRSRLRPPKSQPHHAAGLRSSHRAGGRRPPRGHAPRQAVASLGACHVPCSPARRGLRSCVTAAALKSVQIFSRSPEEGGGFEKRFGGGTTSRFPF